MKTKITIFFLLCFAFFTIKTFAQTPQSITTSATPAPKPDYAAMLQKVKGGDLTVDFKALRFAFADTAASYDDSDLSKKMNEASGSKDYKRALKLADELLDKSFVNVRAHIIAFNANKQLGNTDAADRHNKIALALVNSIVQNGDGRSAKTAWSVIVVAEEYVVLSVLGYQMKSQSTVNQDGHQYDVLEIVNWKTQANEKLYFNVDKVFEAYDKIFKK